MWLCRVRVPEKNHHVDLLFRDHGTQLLIPAKRSAQQFDDGSSQMAFNNFTGSAGSVQFVISQGFAIGNYPFQEFVLTVVVCHEGNPFSRWYSSVCRHNSKIS